MERLLEASNGFFDWLWRASWQAAMVVMLVLLAQWLLARQLTPRWRHALWFLVIIRLALPGSIESRLSLFNLFSPPSLSRIAGPSDTVAASAAVSGQQSAPSSVVRKSSSHFGTWVSLRSLWLAGAVVVAGYFLVGAWRLGRGIRRQRPVTNEAVLNLLEDCKQEMGVFTPLTLLETAQTNSPALLGFVRPRLLLPEGLIQSFSLPELRYVFLHELGHLKRGDILINWLLTVPLAFHWFNPLVWYAVRRIRIDGESACDALALSHAREGENRSYGQTIIKLVERFSAPALAPALVGVLEKKSQMKARIELIASFQKKPQWPVVALLVFALLALVTLTDAQSQIRQFTVQAGLPPLTFDDLPYPSWGKVPAGYGGLNWSNFYVNNSLSNTNPSGYRAGMISAPNVAYNYDAKPASILGVAPFDLLSAALTGAWRDNLRLEAKGYIGPNLAYDRTVFLSATAPTVVNFNYHGVTCVTFISSGGTPHSGSPSNGPVFVMDNLLVIPHSTPSATPVLSR